MKKDDLFHTSPLPCSAFGSIRKHSPPTRSTIIPQTPCFNFPPSACIVFPEVHVNCTYCTYCTDSTSYHPVPLFLATLAYHQLIPSQQNIGNYSPSLHERGISVGSISLYPPAPSPFPPCHIIGLQSIALSLLPTSVAGNLRLVVLSIRNNSPSHSRIRGICRKQLLLTA